MDVATLPSTSRASQICSNKLPTSRARPTTAVLSETQLKTSTGSATHRDPNDEATNDNNLCYKSTRKNICSCYTAPDANLQRSINEDFWDARLNYGQYVGHRTGRDDMDVWTNDNKQKSNR